MKKSILFFLFVFLNLMAFSQTEKANKSALNEISIIAVKSPKGIDIKVFSPKFDDFIEVLVERSNALNGVYRQMKIIYREQLEKATSEIAFRDEFPLNIQNASYYRLRVTTIDSIIKTYPGVEEESYIEFNKNRNKITPPTNLTQKTTSNGDEVSEILTSDQEEKFEKMEEKKGVSWSESLAETKFQVIKESDDQRKLIIELPQIKLIDKLYILINNEKDKSYFTIKEMNKEEIEREYDRGKIEYNFSLTTLVSKGSAFSIKLRLTHETEAFETAAMEFN